MVESLRNLFAIADLRNRVLFTLGLLAVYRVGNHIPTPGVNPEALAVLAQQAQNTMFGLYDMFTGGSLSRITIFALGVMPYISSSIILQLLTVVWPYLERLSKEGELGRRKITQYTRYLTLLLAGVQASRGREVAFFNAALQPEFPIGGGRFRERPRMRINANDQIDRIAGGRTRGPGHAGSAAEIHDRSRCRPGL